MGARFGHHADTGTLILHRGFGRVLVSQGAFWNAITPIAPVAPMPK